VNLVLFLGFAGTQTLKSSFGVRGKSYQARHKTQKAHNATYGTISIFIIFCQGNGRTINCSRQCPQKVEELGAGGDVGGLPFPAMARSFETTGC
jgi:hypothetical protein